MTTSGDEIYGQFARIGRAVGNPLRLHLLDLLDQGERSVEELADAAGARLQNTSAQLQHLRGAGLVTSRKQGTRVYYRLAGPEVSTFLGQLQALGEARLAELHGIAAGFASAVADLNPLTMVELADRLADPDEHIVLIDVRPRVEYLAGHIPGALSVPVDELADRLAELPAETEIIAYCRGPYCVMSPDATRLLRERGRTARPMTDGMSGWRRSGRPVEVTTAGR